MEAQCFTKLSSIERVSSLKDRGVFVKTFSGLRFFFYEELHRMDYDNFLLVCNNIYLSPSLGFTRNAFISLFAHYRGPLRHFIRALIMGTIPSNKTEEQRNKIIAKTGFASDATDPHFYRHASLDYATWGVAAAKITFSIDPSLSPERQTEMLNIIKDAAAKAVAPTVLALKNTPPLPSSVGLEYVESGKSIHFFLARQF